MDKKFEKLVLEIMKEAEADGEPVTKEEAEEMARMELGEKAERRYEQSKVKRKRKPRERKVDEEKKFLLDCLVAGLRSTTDALDIITKNETEISFNAYGNEYTVKLIKHRPSKK
jgi:hypothetical protein